MPWLNLPQPRKLTLLPQGVWLKVFADGARLWMPTAHPPTICGKASKFIRRQTIALPHTFEPVARSMAQHDPFDLKRFVDAQESTFERALAEIGQGRKQTHWMWFIFPQLRGLGRSSTAQYYGLSSLDEACAYLGHPILGRRLDAVTVAATNAPATSLNALFGSPDDMKFKSSMTLFERAAKEADNVFARALDKWCNGERDAATLRLLGAP